MNSDPVESAGAAVGVAEPAATKQKMSEQEFPVWGQWDWIALGFLLVIAAFLRLFNLDYMEFKGDEANGLLLASDLITGKHFPLVGTQSSIGVINPPLFTYLMAIPLLISRNPVVAAGFIALLNCAAVGGCYVFCRRYFGPITAVFAASCFAVNPWAVYYSRKIWQPCLLPLFVVGFIYCLFALFCEGRKKHFLTCCVCLAAATQLHISSIYLGVVLALALACFRPKISWADYAKGFAVFLLVYLPYITYEIQNQGYNARIYLDTFRLHSHAHFEALVTPFMYATTLEFMHFVNWSWLDLLQLALLVTGLVYFFVDWRDRRYALLLLLFCVPLVFLSASKLSLYPHYFIFLYPIQFIVFGIRADAITRESHPRRKVLRYGMIAVLVALVAYQLQSSCMFFTSISKPEPLAWNGYGEFYGPPFLFRVQEIRRLVSAGIVDPDEVQRKLLEGKPPSATQKYDFPATQYIIANLNALP